MSRYSISAYQCKPNLIHFPESECYQNTLSSFHFKFLTESSVMLVLPCFTHNPIHFPESLSSILDSRAASKLAAKIDRVVEEFCVSHELPTREEREASHRKRRAEEEPNGAEGSPGPAKVQFL